MLSNVEWRNETSEADDAFTAYRLLIADVYELAGTSRDTSEAIAAQVGQTAARWHVMSVVSEEAQTVPAIAQRLGQARQSVQRVVNDLVDAGLVELIDNPLHARSPHVALTRKGGSTLEQLFTTSERDRVALLARSGVSTKRLLAARAALRALIDAFED
jgi:DNA-binding MarR family transcriptional regulator